VSSGLHLPHAHINAAHARMDKQTCTHKYVIPHRLVKRPSALHDFVAWMELVWSHLDIAGFKRQQISAVYEQLGTLQTKLMAVSVRSTAIELVQLVCYPYQKWVAQLCSS